METRLTPPITTTENETNNEDATHQAQTEIASGSTTHFVVPLASSSSSSSSSTAPSGPRIERGGRVLRPGNEATILLPASGISGASSVVFEASASSSSATTFTLPSSDVVGMEVPEDENAVRWSTSSSNPSSQMHEVAVAVKGTAVPCKDRPSTTRSSVVSGNNMLSAPIALLTSTCSGAEAGASDISISVNSMCRSWEEKVNVNRRCISHCIE